MRRSVLILFTLPFFQCASAQMHNSHLDSNNGCEKKPDNKNWLSLVQKDIEAKEYYISYDKVLYLYQSPNRFQNIRSYYSPGEWKLQNRKDSIGHNWNLSITTEGIFADDQPLKKNEKSLVTLNENKIQFFQGAYTEEYINNESGVRQNFIIHQAPKGTNEIRTVLSAKGLTARHNGLDKLKFCKDGEDLLTYADLKAWDADHIPLYAQLISCNQNHWELVVQVSEAHYPITIDPIIRNGGPKNANTVIESNQKNAGLGRVVSTAGDVNNDGYDDIIVGAFEFDNGQKDEGAAFVYYGSSKGIITTNFTLLECDQNGAGMGVSVSDAGDVNNDGYDDVVIGAYTYDNGENDEGAAFVFHGGANGINTTAHTVLESNQVIAIMGTFVSSAGDVNGDGFDDIIVAAPYFDTGQINGVVFVFHGSSNGISSNVQTLLVADQDRAGIYSVSDAGDVNKDGYDDIILGSDRYNSGQPYEGAAFVYYGSSKGIISATRTILESNQEEAFFGSSVSSAGDVNGDGFADVIVGAYHYDNGQTDEGSAFVFHGSSGGIKTSANAILECNQEEAFMGISVSSAGDVNGDGYDDVIVGANNFNNGQEAEGVAFVYFGSLTGIITNVGALLESNQAIANMGVVSSAGDVNGDGYDDILVGVARYDHGEDEEGAAFVFHGSPLGIGCLTCEETVNIVNCFNYTSPGGKLWTKTGVYMDTIPNASGCDSLLTINLTINNVNTYVDQWYARLSSQATGAKYQWLNCDSGYSIIEGDTEQTFYATSGNYAVEVSEKGCKDTSSCYRIWIGIGEIETKISISPNPTIGILNIDLGGNCEEISIHLRNPVGQILYTEDFTSVQKIKMLFDWPPGLYFLEVQTADGKFATTKVLKE